MIASTCWLYHRVVPVLLGTIEFLLIKYIHNIVVSFVVPWSFLHISLSYYTALIPWLRALVDFKINTGFLNHNDCLQHYLLLMVDLELWSLLQKFTVSWSAICCTWKFSFRSRAVWNNLLPSHFNEFCERRKYVDRHINNKKGTNTNKAYFFSLITFILCSHRLVSWRPLMWGTYVNT